MSERATLDRMWNERSLWARERAHEIYPSDHLRDLPEVEAREQMVKLIERRQQGWFELVTATNQPSLHLATAWLRYRYKLELLPVVARAIWQVQGCPEAPNRTS